MERTGLLHLLKKPELEEELLTVYSRGWIRGEGLGTTMSKDVYSKALSEIQSADELCEPVRELMKLKSKPLLRNKVVNEADVADLEQDMLIRVMDRFEAARKSPDLSVGAFLKQVATQTISNDRRYRYAKCRDYRRTVSMNNPVSAGSSMEFADLFASPRSDGLMVQCKLDVRAKLEQLNRSQRHLCLRLARYSIAEICRQDNQTRPQVEKRVRELRPYFSEIVDME